MQGILTEEKQSQNGQHLSRRKVLSFNDEILLIRRGRASSALPRALQRCSTVLYPNGFLQNREYALIPFRFFLPQILSKLERIYFRDRCISVALVTPVIDANAKNALIQTLTFAGNCLICTKDPHREIVAAELMDEYGLPALLTTQKKSLKQADILLTFEDPNAWIRQCKSEAVILNLSKAPVKINYGRMIVEGVELKPIPSLWDPLPKDVDWTAFCGLNLPALQEQLELRHPIYAKG